MSQSNFTNSPPVHQQVNLYILYICTQNSSSRLMLSFSNSQGQIARQTFVPKALCLGQNHIGVHISRLLLKTADIRSENHKFLCLASLPLYHRTTLAHAAIAKHSLHTAVVTTGGLFYSNPTAQKQQRERQAETKREARPDRCSENS